MSTEKINVAEIFGENVFNDTVMQERLPKKVYKNLKKTIEEGYTLYALVSTIDRCYGRKARLLYLCTAAKRKSAYELLR